MAPKSESDRVVRSSAWGATGQAGEGRFRHWARLARRMGVERMVLRTSERFVKGLRKNPRKGAITGTHGPTSLMPGT